MRKQKIVASTAALLAAAVGKVSLAQTLSLPANDGFSYSSGPLTNVNQWSQLVTATPQGSVTINSSKNLSYTGLPTSATGLAVVSNDATGGNKLPISTQNMTSGSEVYFSLLMRVTDLTNLIASTTTGTFFAGLTPAGTTGSTTAGNAYLRIRRDPNATADHWQFGIGKDQTTTGSNVVWQAAGTSYTVDTTTESNNPTFLVVGRYTNGSGASLWINPTSNVFGTADSAIDSTLAPSLTASSGTDNTTVGYFFLRQLAHGTNQGTPQALQVDDVRVGANWASVAPDVWSGTTSNWGADSNWYIGTHPDSAGVIPTFADISTASRSVDIGAGRIVGGLIFSSATGYTINSSSGGVLSMSSPDANVSITSVAGNHTIGAPVSLSKNLVVDVEANSVTMNGAVSGATAGISKTGAGLLVLGASNNYGGNVTINAGEVRAVDGVGLTTSANLAITGGAFESAVTPFIRSLGTGSGNVQLTSSSFAGGFSASGTNVVLDLGGTGAGTGGTLVWGAANNCNPNGLLLNASTADHTIELKNAIDLAGATRAIEVDATNPAASATISNVISNSTATFGINKTGAGVLILTATNTYQGQTTITAGVLRGGDGTAIPNNGGNSVLTLQGGVYEPTSPTFTRTLGAANGNVRLSSGTTGFSAYGLGQPLVINFGGNANPTQFQWSNTGGANAFQPQALVLNYTDATDPIALLNPVNLGTGVRTIFVGANTATMSGALSAGSSSAAIIKTGAGTLVLSGSNSYATGALALVSGSYTGGIQIIGGVLSATQENSLGTAPSSAADDILLDGGTLHIDNTFDLNANRGIVLGNNGGTIDVGSGLASSYGSTIGIHGPHPFTKTGGGNLTTNGVNVGGLQVDGGVFSVASGRSAAKTSTIGNLSVGASAKIDLADNDVIYNYTGGASTTRLAYVRNQLIAGYNVGAWNGANGITSSLAATNATSAHPTALGYAEASSTGLMSFDGTATDADMILVRYTSSGDANLDGTVGTGDFILLGQNFNKSSNVNWIDGDFNYDGVVNALDFNLLATNFGQTIASPPVLGSLVPEPGTVALFAAMGLLAGRRHRRRGKHEPAFV